jgi:hypothetical protein
VRALLRATKLHEARLPCSKAAAWRDSSQANSVWGALGAPNVFFTFNPAELNVKMCLQTCGVETTVDFKGVPLDRGSAMERWRAVAANPVACVRFYMAFVDALFEVIFGWPRGATAQGTQSCPLGGVLWWLLKTEVSGRAALHAHLLALLSALRAERLHRVFVTEKGQHPQLEAQLQGLMERVMEACLPDGYTSERIPFADGACSDALRRKSCPSGRRLTQ